MQTHEHSTSLWSHSGQCCPLQSLQQRWVAAFKQQQCPALLAAWEKQYLFSRAGHPQTVWSCRFWEKQTLWMKAWKSHSRIDPTENHKAWEKSRRQPLTFTWPQLPHVLITPVEYILSCMGRIRQLSVIQCQRGYPLIKVSVWMKILLKSFPLSAKQVHHKYIRPSIFQIWFDHTSKSGYLSHFNREIKSAPAVLRLLSLLPLRKSPHQQVQMTLWWQPH